MGAPDLKELPSHEFLSALVRTDPQQYESLRATLIAELIESAPERLKPRLRGVQFRIDCERRLSKSALGLTIKLSSLMWASFLNLNDRLQELGRPGEASVAALESGPMRLAEPGAQILEFRPQTEIRTPR